MMLEKGDKMLVDANNNPIENTESEQEEPRAMTPEDLKLNYFDPEVVLRGVNGKTVCHCVAIIQVGADAPDKVINEVAQKFWNYGISEGKRKTEDVSHIRAARQGLKDFLVAADTVYKILDDYVEPEEITLTEEEIDAEDIDNGEC
jgi:hypothetical protein